MKNQTIKTVVAMKSITENSAYKQALSDLITLEVETASIPEDFGAEKDFEANPAFEAAQAAIRSGWLALAAIVDAHCARQRF